MNAMPNTITRLEGLSSQLIESSDKLSKVITTLESKLGALKLDIAVWVKDPVLLEVKNEGDGGLEDFAYAYFGYAKINDAWRLWIKKDGDPTLDAGESNGVHPHYVQLNQAPRDIRLKALQQFPQLVTELERQTEALIQEVETAKIPRLEGLTFQLSKSSDKLSHEITNLESKLRALKLDISAWVKDPLLLEEKNEEDEELVGLAYAYLGYAKINDVWCLWIRKGRESDDDLGESNGDDPLYVQLKQAPRDICLKALQQFPQLIMELERQTEAVIEEVETAKMIAEIGNGDFKKGVDLTGK